MSETLTYAIVFVVYIAVLIIVGLVTSRRTKNVEDFYLGGRQIGPWVTAMSYVAAYFSSVVIIGGGGFGYKFGMATIWIGAINVLLGGFLCWIVLGPRIRRITQRLRTMTIPEFLMVRYRSRFALMLSAIVIVLLLVIYNVSMLKGMGHAFEVLMNIPYVYGVILSGVVILFYVSIGGYLAVVWTSFIQAWVMGFGLILLAAMTLRSAGGLAAANRAVESVDPALLATPGVWGWAGLVSYAMIVSFGVWGMPQMVIRFYSIKSVKVIKLGTVIATVGTALALLPYMCGAISRAMYPGLANADLAIPTLTKHVLSPLGGAVVLAAIAAAGMSTFSSVLIIISSSLVQDLMIRGMRMKINVSSTLLYGKIASAVVGLVSLLIAFRPPALVLTLTAFAWAVIASTTLWPILFGIYSRRVTHHACVASMVGGCLTALVWLALRNPWGIHGFIPGVGMGLLLIVLVSAITPRYEGSHLSNVFDGGRSSSGQHAGIEPAMPHGEA